MHRAAAGGRAFSPGRHLTCRSQRARQPEKSSTPPVAEDGEEAWEEEEGVSPTGRVKHSSGWRLILYAYRRRSAASCYTILNVSETRGMRAHSTKIVQLSLASPRPPPAPLAASGRRSWTKSKRRRTMPPPPFPLQLLPLLPISLLRHQQATTATTAMLVEEEEEEDLV